MDKFSRRSDRITDPHPDISLNRRSVTEISRLRQETLHVLTSRRGHETVPIRVSSEPRSAECLNKILQEIRSTLAESRLKSDLDYALYLHVIDDIDFDCQQPFLAQVLQELISNAVVAMRGREDGRIDVTATQHQERLFVQVADNGPGLPCGMSSWITDWACNGVKGLRHKGSGLDTAALLVAIAGGQLGVVSTSSEGTRLGFSVPLPGEMAARHRSAPGA